MLKRWNVKPVDRSAVRELQSSLGVGELFGAVLSARGITMPDRAREFLNHTEEIESPFALTDVQAAAERINAAIDSGEKIAVFGDYDVDGITASAIMYSYLYDMGADVSVSIPMREGEGYGLSISAVSALAEQGVTLIITVDNGIAAIEEVEHASSLGVDVVVCDHHLPGATLPRAIAVVDPLREDDCSRFKALSGAGVALKLIAAVEGCEVADLFDTYAGLAAIGTIADIMPLTGENRVIVSAGIECLRRCDNLGLSCLCECAGINLGEIDSRTIAFGISPRLNAAGRIGSATDAFELLTTEDEDNAERLASMLCSQNSDRQTIEKDISSRIEEMLIADTEPLRDPVMIVDAKDCHPGVIGIVCSRLVERYGKPAIVINTDGEQGKGSGRSLPGFSLYDALVYCSDALDRFGGHELAAGLTITTENIPMFRQKMREYCSGRAMPFPSIFADCEVSANQITPESVEDLSLLEPFGQMNEQPVFCLRGGVVEDVSPLSDGKHTRIQINFAGKSLRFAQFGVPPDALGYPVGYSVDVLFQASIYASQSRRSVSLRLVSIHPSGFDDNVESLDDYRKGLYGTANYHIDRANVAVVYRALKQHPYPLDDCALLINDCKAQSAAQTLSALDVLIELGLAERKDYGRCSAVFAVADKRAELGDSATFKRLSEN